LLGFVFALRSISELELLLKRNALSILLLVLIAKAKSDVHLKANLNKK